MSLFLRPCVACFEGFAAKCQIVSNAFLLWTGNTDHTMLDVGNTTSVRVLQWVTELTGNLVVSVQWPMLRKILQVSWTAKKTNEWVLNKAGVKRELLDTVKARKLAYCGHTMRKQGSCLEKEIMQGTMPGARRQGRPRTAWMDNIKTWTGLSMEESVRMTEDRDKWRKYVSGVANSRIEDG